MKILKFTPSFVILALSYLTGAFIYAEFNSALWPIDGRGVIALTGLAIAGVVQAFAYKLGGV